MAAPNSSPTGYEAFIKDSYAAFKDNETTKGSTTEAEESWTKSVADGAAAGAETIKSGAQTVMTNYFPAKNPCEGACGKVPGLAASSSSDKSGAESEKKPSSWAEKMSNQCNMDTACGNLQVECMQKVDEPSRANALTDQGELLKIEGPSPPKPWTEKLSDKVQMAHKTVAKSTNDLLASLGLATKRDQALITDYYKSEPASNPKGPEKSLSEKMQEAQASLMNTQVSLVNTGMSTLGLDAKEIAKEKKQTKITDYDPNRPAAETAPSADAASPPAEAPTTADDVATVVSIATESDSEEKDEKESSPWNMWKRVKGLLSKIKVPEKTPSCEETQEAFEKAVPKVDVPSCPTPKEMPSLSIFSCNPQDFDEEPKVTGVAEENKTGEVNDNCQKLTEVNPVKVEDTHNAPRTTPEEMKKTEEAKVEETEKVEEPASPKASKLPW
eukprot:CAMPEP_0172531630 /NCGR_PEP_ID=MMETSP1067-20121228/4953_1 /TAXON_ID=265564 ORGANISM="Thalassiosira punctigera, Strain Tpunct2005C2" /NCGR_SAMPLE_ID=MMETSP1067 /ASSEMBLY_ACC=CAM_ASM_000444 /LENGTH=441 /DNA_ID=CAMNT_0013316027 /DNA_START=145 /DNA_END=1467 /DNA_ORIENTATION=+